MVLVKIKGDNLCKLLRIIGSMKALYILSIITRHMICT